MLRTPPLLKKTGVALVGALCLGTTTPGLAQEGTAISQAEAQLEQIRQAIVSAALDRPTQVLSTAWIDQQGKLHETAHFQTDAEVRSIRMPLFEKTKPAAAPSQIKVELLPSAWRQKMKADSPCQAPERRLRQPLKIFSVTGPGIDGAQAFHSQTLLQALRQHWQEQVQASQRWWPQVLDEPAPSSYEAALTTSADTHTAWAVRLNLSAVNQAPALPLLWYERLQQRLSLDDQPPAQPWLWQLTLSMGTLTEGGAFQPQWSRQATVAINAQDQTTAPQTWLAGLQRRLGPVVQDWAKALDEAWTCEPVQFQVSNPPGSGLLINAGSRSGLMAGDRLLLVAPENIPRKILENGAMKHLRLAEVVQVGKHQTTIRQLAGPAAGTHGHWLALPL